jgi:hypothetical protein
MQVCKNYAKRSGHINGCGEGGFATPATNRIGAVKCAYFLLLK